MLHQQILNSKIDDNKLCIAIVTVNTADTSLAEKFLTFSKVLLTFSIEFSQKLLNNVSTLCLSDLNSKLKVVSNQSRLQDYKHICKFSWQKC